jgi:hypothetical protein
MKDISSGSVRPRQVSHLEITRQHCTLNSAGDTERQLLLHPNVSKLTITYQTTRRQKLSFVFGCSWAPRQTPAASCSRLGFVWYSVRISAGTPAILAEIFLLYLSLSRQMPNQRMAAPPSDATNSVLRTHAGPALSVASGTRCCAPEVVGELSSE